LGLEVGGRGGAAWARKAGEGWDADADPDIATGPRRHAQVRLEGGREMGTGGSPWIGADGVGAGGGASRGGHRPDRVAGQDGLPGGEEERGEDG
jgi:hypothetical protein